MSKLMALIQALLVRFQPRQAYDEAYLNHAVDIDDLERRMRQLDSRGRASSLGGELSHVFR